MLGDRRRQRRLAMINMSYRPYVYMRLLPLKSLLRHRYLPFKTLLTIGYLFRPLRHINGHHINIIKPTTGIEPVNPFLTKEVLYLLSYVGENGAGNGIRTRDPQLGRLTL